MTCCTTFRYKGLSSHLLCNKKYHISGSKIGRHSFAIVGFPSACSAFPGRPTAGCAPGLHYRHCKISPGENFATFLKDETFPRNCPPTKHPPLYNMGFSRSANHQWIQWHYVAITVWLCQAQSCFSRGAKVACRQFPFNNSSTV